MSTVQVYKDDHLHNQSFLMVHGDSNGGAKEYLRIMDKTIVEVACTVRDT